MGESAVLAHSYSFAAPNESHEDNTIHALSQSVSFGKFMSEDLDWGKWSSFSHKKYVEEAEKFSRPGSVAQKKAFFEAHYKRIAEAKKAASQEQPPPHTLKTQTPLNPQPDNDEPGNRRIQIDEDIVVSDNKPDDSLEEIENSLKEEEDLSYEDREKKKEGRSITKNRPVFRLSLEKTIPPKMEIDSSEERSERPTTQSSEKNEEKPIRRQRFSFLNCFSGNAKTQDQNQSTEKRKTEMKKQKQRFLCFCIKPKTVRES